MLVDIGFRLFFTFVPYCVYVHEHDFHCLLSKNNLFLKETCPSLSDAQLKCPLSSLVHLCNMSQSNFSLKKMEIIACSSQLMAVLVT